MKLTQNKNTKAIKSGMTLLELTVVILVLLSLIAILFIGARAWKRGSDRAGCIMNIRNVQQAARGHMNMMNTPNTVPPTTDLYSSDAVAAVAADPVAGTPGSPAVDAVEGYLPAPTCPAGGTYTYSTASAAPGSVFLTCDEDGHVPTGTSTW